MSKIVNVVPSGQTEQAPVESAQEKPAGYAYVRAWERDRLISLVRTACSEVDALLHKVDGRYGKPRLNDEECQPVVDEALKCLDIAENYARMLAGCVGIYRPAKPASWSGEPAF